MLNSSTAATVTVRGRQPGARGAAVAALLLSLWGCASSPVERSDRLAEAAGATRTLVTGVGYHHVVYLRHLSSSARSLHVYIGGDGHAFVSRHQVARDPTAERPLALELMLSDEAPSAYLGRPCYNGPPDDSCQPLLWTLERYSEAVVASTAAALAELVRRCPRAGVPSSATAAAG